MDATSDKPQFTRAIEVLRSDTGCYEFAGHRDLPWGEVLQYAEGVKVVGPLRGWGDWAHVVEVDFGQGGAIYFAR